MIKLLESFGKCSCQYTVSPSVAVFHHARIYDVETKALKSMKPLEPKHLHSLNGDLDLLGLYPMFLPLICCWGIFLNYTNHQRELPPSIAAAIADGHLNPVTMEVFNYQSAAESCLTSVNSLACDHIDKDETQVASTQKSCITIFSTNQANEEYVTVPEDIAVDRKKYEKEAVALGKLIAPSERLQVVEHEVDWRAVPHNNPFKQREKHAGR